MMRCMLDLTAVGAQQKAYWQKHEAGDGRDLIYRPGMGQKSKDEAC